MPEAEGGDVMSDDAGKAVVQRAIAAWNERDADAFAGCYTEPLLVRTGEGEDDVPVTREQHREAARIWWERFPDLDEVILEMLAEGDRVLVRTRSTGTLQAAWRGIEPTGQPVAWDAWYVYRMEDGLIAEERMLMDMLGLFVQLGALEIPGS